MNNNETKKRKFSLYAIASGKPGNKFTEKEFLKITGKVSKPGGHNTDKTIEMDDGYVYHADSQQEISTIKKLVSSGNVKLLRGQCLKIKYIFEGEVHDYYPDVVVLTNTNKIVVIEIKEVVDMYVKRNERKYNALKKYCEKHGYLYLMCDKKLTSFEKLKEKYGLSIVETAIDNALKNKGYFSKKDYERLIEGADRKKIKKIRRSIGIYKAKHAKKIMFIGDLTHNIDKFRIRRTRKKKKKQII